MLSGCSYSSGTVSCPQGGGGSWHTARMGVALEASVPVCQPGSATVSSDPSQGTAILGRAIGVIERLANPVALPVLPLPERMLSPEVEAKR
jgi:hypothetical protein